MSKPQVRRVLLVAHLVSSIALMGHLLVVIALGMAIEGDPSLGAAPILTVYRESITPAFGGGLSLVSLITGVALGLVTKWGVFRHFWVVAKMVLLVVTVATGIALGPSVSVATAQFAMLLAATVLSVYKPRRRQSYGRVARPSLSSLATSPSPVSSEVTAKQR
jgi:hypothetical protein